MALYKNKYRIESSRLGTHDYGSEGLYFITICSFNKNPIFGDIIRGEAVLSDIGKIVDNEWRKSFEIRAELICHSHVIMPNHIHSIIELNHENPVERHIQNRQSIANREQRQNGIFINGAAYRSTRSISSFVAGFKSAATKQINIYLKSPGRQIWQSRFHDRIIRNNHEYKRIRKYIQNNPQKWEYDRFYKHQN